MPCCGCWWNGRQRHRPPDPAESGNPRNKCALQPGHSLMDWIRLGNSGKDLTGVGGQIRPVHPSELATHNTKNDAWLAIRGRVYNITHYLPYHPGGPEELMRGAGLDATELFDKVHPWVNYDSLLAKCLVGPLRFDRPNAEDLFDSFNSSPKSERLREPSKAQELVRKSMENLANCITPARKKITNKTDENVKCSPPSKIMQSLIHSSELPVSISRRAASSPVKTQKNIEDTPPSLRFDWIQTSTKLTISVYTGHLANPGGCARLTEGILLIEVVTNDWLRTIKLVPEEPLKEPLQLRVFAESGKLEIIAQKAEMKVWKSCGETSLSTAIKITTPRNVECKVDGISAVTHDTMLLALTPSAGPVVVPIGHHVRVHQTLAGSECIRSYTPVGDNWGSPVEVSAPLKLAIKRYKLGVLSPILTSLKVGGLITVSGPYGNFQLYKLKTVRTIFLIAAGTGITPMLSLLKFMLSRSNPRCERIILLFFNKTEEDILFRENFEEIMNQDDRLNVTHVLSNASSTWTGHKGRISKELLSELLGESAFKVADEFTRFACLCGPTEFTQAGVDILKNLGLKETFIHAFIG
ncbi:cytochrome b5 reductase 4-like isoform X2 [Battus philenor]|uniref:cytochrome b5 reductase 4-like isoform X2 n=1 Tax=Battus philenor TaxID=42288 RepID=UPI0035CED407